jgi:ferric-dicitrate binding protein FerR (iron transport regulator)
MKIQPFAMLLLPAVRVSVVLILLALAGGTAAADTAIGTVSRIEKNAIAIRAGDTYTLRISDLVFQKDRLETGTASRLEVTFNDGTRLIMGENTRLDLDTYVFDPELNAGSILVDVLNGAFRFVTGQLSALNDKSLMIKTRFAYIGVRGTDFFAGPALGKYGVLLLDGAVVVRNSGGERLLTEPRTGVNVISETERPSPVVPWGDGRIRAALEAVAFSSE